MAKIQDEVDRVVAAIAEVKGAVVPLAGAIDALEAQVTAATQNPDVPQAVSDQLTAALADLKTVSDGIKAAVADAGDDVDEAATPPAGEPTP